MRRTHGRSRPFIMRMNVARRFLARDAPLTCTPDSAFPIPRATDLAGTMLITVPQCAQAMISQLTDSTVLGRTVNPKVGFLQVEQCKTGILDALVSAGLRLLRRQPRSVAWPKLAFEALSDLPMNCRQDPTPK
jgi:hypothetical protein